jgi:hypothetical protein
LECKFVQPLWKTVWRLPKNLKIEPPYDPAIPHLGIYPNECKSGYNKYMFNAVYNSQAMEIAKMPYN